MDIGKKGIFFTMISILIVTGIVIAATPPAFQTNEDSITEVQTRFSVANNYVNDLENHYIERALAASSYKALQSMVVYMNQTKSAFFSDDEEFRMAFEELVINGTLLHASPADPAISIHMRNSTFRHFMGKIANASNEALKMSTNFSLDDGSVHVGIYQDNSTGPWHLAVNITLNYSMHAGFAKWNNTVFAKSIVPIQGIQDPLYLIASENYGQVFGNTIKADNSTVWTPSLFLYHVGNRTYEEQEKGPSFLQRFYYNPATHEGSKCCGIESVINPKYYGDMINQLENPSLPVDLTPQTSYADWCFFSQSDFLWNTPICPASEYGLLWNISGITTDDLSYHSSTPPADGPKYYMLKLDSLHGSTYNISPRLTHNCC